MTRYDLKEAAPEYCPVMIVLINLATNGLKLIMSHDSVTERHYQEKILYGENIQMDKSCSRKNSNLLLYFFFIIINWLLTLLSLFYLFFNPFTLKVKSARCEFKHH